MNNDINVILVWAFIFMVGSMIGWVLEVFYRRFFSDTNPERKWINPGFLMGPYLPLYGFSLLVLYLMAKIPLDFVKNPTTRKIVLFFFMAVVITFVEYIAGLIFIKKMNIKLWDYTEDWGNIQGIICPKYSFYWMLLSAGYYFFIHGKVIGFIYWLSNHLTFSFFGGFVYGIFAIDLFVSLRVGVKIRNFARENQIVVRYEELKDKVMRKNESIKLRINFMFPVIANPKSFKDALKEYAEGAKAKVSGGAKVITDGIGAIGKSVGSVAEKTIGVPIKKVGEGIKTDRYMRDVNRIKNESEK